MRKLTSLTLVSTIISLTLTSCLNVSRGQSLQGGSQLIVELQETSSVPKISERELEAVIQVIEGRTTVLVFQRQLSKKLR
ncbi:protein-export membrane protein SecD [Calothrix sp. NIES-4101]|nr:protein-export membrane protein SecD [Calothrix sp. NIES-4101]